MSIFLRRSNLLIVFPSIQRDCSVAHPKGHCHLGISLAMTDARHGRGVAVGVGVGNCTSAGGGRHELKSDPTINR